MKNAMNTTECVEQQYRSDKGLGTRISLHEKYSINKKGYNNWIMEQYEISDDMKVLELGCGNGAMWKKYRGKLERCRQVYLTDLSEGMLETARETLGEFENVTYQAIDIGMRKSTFSEVESMEFRRVFDTIPEQFDQYRPRYCAELFADLIDHAKIGPGKAVLELGPGPGQATEPILDTGCDYHAIELGEHLADMMKKKYGNRPNFDIVNDDFITHDFGMQKFDMIYSAATIQWIPEEIAFSKTFELLKPGGTLAMLLTRADYKTPDEELYAKIQEVYSAYFKPETEYKHGKFTYSNAVNYGYIDFEEREFHGRREFTADEYVAFCGTHCDHIVIREEYKNRFFEGLRNAVAEAGNRGVFLDTYVMFLAKKPV